MIAAVHALAGAALGRFCKTPLQAFLVGAVSHLVADALPHRDLKLPEEGLLLAGALGLIAVAQGTDSREFAGALGAAAPDAENVVVRVAGLPEDRMLLPTHRKRHGREVSSLKPQVAIALGCLAMLAFSHKKRSKHGTPRGIPE